MSVGHRKLKLGHNNLLVCRTPEAETRRPSSRNIILFPLTQTYMVLFLKHKCLTKSENNYRRPDFSSAAEFFRLIGRKALAKSWQYCNLVGQNPRDLAASPERTVRFCMMLLMPGFPHVFFTKQVVRHVKLVQNWTICYQLFQIFSIRCRERN